MAWWRKPLKAVQFNIEDPYGFYADKITADTLVDLALKTHADLLIVFARDAWGRVFYRGSDIYPRHPRAALDIAELVQKARKHGIKVVAMVAHTANRYLYRLHPDWAQKTKTGEIIVLEHYPRKEKIEDPHWPQICPNSPALDLYFTKEVEEVFRIADVDGVLLDSFRYMPDPPKACYCKFCKETFKREHGFDLPENSNPEDEAFRKAWEWRYDVVRYSISKLMEVAKKMKEDALFFYNSHPAGWAGRGNIVVAKSRGFLNAVFAEASEADSRGPGLLTFISKLSKALIGDEKPVFVTRNLFYGLRTVQSATREQVLQGIREIVASGGYPVATIFSSQFIEDPRGIEYLAEAYEEIDRIKPYITGVDPVKYLGIVFDPETHDKYYFEKPDYYIGEVEGFTMMAFDRNVPWGFIASYDVSDLEKLSSYPIVVAPAMSVVGDDEEEAFKSYVNNGGVLVVTHEFGVMRPDYTYRHAFAAQDALGNFYEGLFWVGYSYLDLNADEKIAKEYWSGLPANVIFGDHSTVFAKERAEPRVGEIVRARPVTSRVLAWGKLGRSAYGYEYTLGRSTPAPDSRLSVAGITVNKYGEGTTIYYSVRLGTHYSRLGHPDYAELFWRPLFRHAPMPDVYVEGPETLQVEPYRRKGEDHAYVVHIINHSYNQRILSTQIGPSKQALPGFDPSYRVHPTRIIVPVKNVEIVTRIEPGKRYTARDALTEEEFRIEITGPLAHVKIPEISEYRLVIVEPKS